MRISTRQVFWGGIVALFLANGESLRVSAQHGAQLEANRQAANRKSQDSIEQAKAIQKQSATALARAPACISVVLTATGGDGRFVEGAAVNTGGDSALVLSDGRLICNDWDTGVMQGGKITDIASVSAEDKAEYDKLRKGIAIDEKR
jgi:hypothetical protein